MENVLRATIIQDRLRRRPIPGLAGRRPIRHGAPILWPASYPARWATPAPRWT